ncbi:hypothetical protein N656DRAFT_456421 [Canariomyces notabilis]|uniref:Uncharacterized protein n=1 Tax=Canariomyces notabilis TaxID=2074819 RepID=A0AAN6T7E9_9PEZI|nr:hypothetical protein N656DRAFT_456421 [Canariomyces arenarius]
MDRTADRFASISGSSCILALLSFSAIAASFRSTTTILFRGFWAEFACRIGLLMAIFGPDDSTAAPFAKSKSRFFSGPSLSGWRAGPNTAVVGTGSGAAVSLRRIPCRPVGNPTSVSSLTLGASLGLTNVVEDRIAASLRSS